MGTVDGELAAVLVCGVITVRAARWAAEVLGGDPG